MCIECVFDVQCGQAFRCEMSQCALGSNVKSPLDTTIGTKISHEKSTWDAYY